MVVAEQKKEEKDTQNTRKKKKQRTKTDKKNADFLPFLALFQGKEICFVLSGKNFFPTTPSCRSYLMYDAAE